MFYAAKHLAWGLHSLLCWLIPCFPEVSAACWPHLFSLCTLTWILKWEEVAQDILLPQGDWTVCSVPPRPLDIRQMVVHTKIIQERNTGMEFTPLWLSSEVWSPCGFSWPFHLFLATFISAFHICWLDFLVFYGSSKRLRKQCDQRRG